MYWYMYLSENYPSNNILEKLPPMIISTCLTTAPINSHSNFFQTTTSLPKLGDCGVWEGGEEVGGLELHVVVRGVVALGEWGLVWGFVVLESVSL